MTVPREVNVRLFVPKDAEPVRELIHSTIKACYTDCYPARVVEYFLQYHSKSEILRRARRGTTIVAEVGGRIVATGTLKHQYIIAVFVCRRLQGRGLGRRIMEALEERARTERLGKVLLDVSLPSRPFYERIGYEGFEPAFLDVGEGRRLDYWKANKRLDGGHCRRRSVVQGDFHLRQPMNEYTIITIGISPSWDIVCSARAFVWGRHQAIERQAMTAAGKALNVSRALAGLARRSIAAGLWGREDLAMALADLRATPQIAARMTAVTGQTRRNITLVDTGRGREMHLRSPNPLAMPQNLRRLTRDLAGMVGERTICVFAGAVPDGAVKEFVRMVRTCRAKGARIVVDTSGAALRAAVELGGLWMIKPNVEELGELIGRSIHDRSEAIGRAAQTLTDRVELVVVSRGARGAVAITQDLKIGRTAPKIRTVCHTVGCGDYLLAGFLDGYLSICPRIESGRPDCKAIQRGLLRGVSLASKRAAGRV